MKNIKQITLFVLAIFITGTSVAQPSNKINYQAVARNAAGITLQNQSVNVRLSIHVGSANGAVEYSEMQLTTTNNFGVLNLQIGTGIVVSGNYNNINWGDNTRYLQVEIDPTGGTNFIGMGTSELVSVPHALYANRAKTSDQWSSNGNDISNSNIGNVGIGTTTPTQKLDVNGIAQVIGDGVNAQVYLSPFGTGTNDPATKIVSADDGGFGAHLDFYTKPIGSVSNPATFRMRIQNDGNVGIGTSTPTQKLDVNGYLQITDHLIFNSASGVVNFGPAGALLFRSLNTQGDLSSYNELMVISAAGDVGIGTTTPVNRLNLIGASNDPSIPGYTSSGILRVGVSGNEGIDFGKMSNSPYSGWIQSGIDGSTADPLVLQPVSGNVGIGTNDPYTAKLVIAGPSGSEGLDLSSTDQYANVRVLRNSFGTTDQDMYIGYGSGSNSQLHLFSNNSETVTIQNDNVGIGNAAPAYKLDINGVTHMTANYGVIGTCNWSYYSDANCNGAGVQWSAGSYSNMSLLADGRIFATEFHAYSDQRIKKDFVRSNCSNDLALLNQLVVTDYRYKDEPVNGSSFKKGFVAQEVEKVFPQAVSKHSDYITDIFALSEKTTLANGVLTVTMKNAHNLKQGDHVRLIIPSGKLEKTVNVISENTFTVSDWTENVNSVFVYGKLVDDYRTVDYDAIYTLGVSAIKELSNQLNEMKVENLSLKQANENLTHSINTVQTKMQVLEAKVELLSNPATTAKK